MMNDNAKLAGVAVRACVRLASRVNARVHVDVRACDDSYNASGNNSVNYTDLV